MGAAQRDHDSRLVENSGAAVAESGGDLHLHISGVLGEGCRVDGEGHRGGCDVVVGEADGGGFDGEAIRLTREFDGLVALGQVVVVHRDGQRLAARRLLGRNGDREIGGLVVRPQIHMGAAQGDGDFGVDEDCGTPVAEGGGDLHLRISGAFVQARRVNGQHHRGRSHVVVRDRDLGSGHLQGDRGGGGASRHGGSAFDHDGLGDVALGQVVVVQRQRERCAGLRLPGCDRDRLPGGPPGRVVAAIGLLGGTGVRNRHLHRGAQGPGPGQRCRHCHRGDAVSLAQTGLIDGEGHRRGRADVDLRIGHGGIALIVAGRGSGGNRVRVGRPHGERSIDECVDPGIDRAHLSRLVVVGALAVDEVVIHAIDARKGAARGEVAGTDGNAADPVGIRQLPGDGDTRSFGIDLGAYPGDRLRRTLGLAGYLSRSRQTRPKEGAQPYRDQPPNQSSAMRHF